jgi:deazaflavin-dependent oxidoreductase (nitroreductase family)
MDISPIAEARLRRIFRSFNRFMVFVFRLGLGNIGNGNRYVGWIMVIKHRGRKSGLTRYAPVNYFEDGDFVYCTAGFGPRTHWYRNMQADPRVELWLPDSRWAGTAEDISTDPRGVEILRQVLFAAGFAGPLFGANPRKLSDDDLARMLKKYRLVRIRKAQALTGPDGPGEYAWIWPLATFILLGLLLRRRRNGP